MRRGQIANVVDSLGRIGAIFTGSRHVGILLASCQGGNVPDFDDSRKIILLILCYSLLFFGVFVFFAHVDAMTRKRMVCQSRLYKCAVAIHEFQNLYSGDKFFPFFGTWDVTQEYWSWRAAVANVFYRENRLKLDEPWNSAYNYPLMQGNKEQERFFTCPCDYPHEKRVSYVAVTGPGTVWTEANAGRLKNPHENYPHHIIIIETSEPKNHWAEPGDDVSPEEVIRLFQADPGLKRNSRQSIFTKGHWPKRFVRADGSVGDFGQLKDVDELRKLLVVPEQKMPL